jgi:NAD(P)-dependent dehydrogenase (short-subunit alcohol dehydrogenase family)
MRPDVLLITGGASGIGAALFEAAIADGRIVVGFDINDEAIAAQQKRFATAGARANFTCVDIVDEAAVTRAVHEVEDDIGPITGLVNSAGIGREAPFLETSASMFRAILEVNLIGSFIVARQVAAAMVARSAGSIINIASVSGLVGNVGRAAYGASKGGIITLTKVMAVELARYGVRVNAIAPGPVETPMVRGMHSPETRQSWIATVPQGRYADPREIAGAVRFLLDERGSGFITGQTLAIDGGFSVAGIMWPAQGDQSDIGRHQHSG